MQLVEHLNDLVRLQNTLLCKFRGIIPSSYIDDDGNLSRLARKKLNELEVDGENWELRFHGNGVCFSRNKDGLEVDFDKHLDKPNSFSPWRVAIYLESLGNHKDHNELRTMFDELDLNKIEYDRYELRQ